MRRAERAGQGLAFSFLLPLAGLSPFPFCKIAHVLVLMMKYIKIADLLVR